ncbi:MAG: hypothetical protein K0S74_118 [Chlamydiales bacterium]|jgi:hypothetical protein|nr:hypothetical protein [Chlamydiales bacterium]
MFGLENKSKDGSSGKRNPAFFDLESKLKDILFYNKTQEHIVQQTEKIRQEQRKGCNPDEFEQLASLAQGYMALKQVLKKTYILQNKK